LVDRNECPSLVGYRPAEAEEVARQCGWQIHWVISEPPRWLSPNHEARVGRQRVSGDKEVELLQVLVPVLSEENAGTEDESDM
jgi:hypothetical protein